MTLTISVDSDPSESSYSTYSVESDPLELSYPSVICLTSDSSASSASLALTPVRGHGFIRTRAVPRRRRHACGGGHEDNAPSSFGNRYLPFDG